MTGEFRRIMSWQLEELLERVRHDPEAFADFLYPQMRTFDPPDPELSVGKGWHGIHFLLNGEPYKVTSVAGRAVFGGHEAGADLSYGPVRYMEPSEVKAVAEALRGIREEEFKSRFNPQGFREAGIYSAGDWSHPGDLPWLWETFQALRDFYSAGTECGDVMLFRLA